MSDSAVTERPSRDLAGGAELLREVLKLMSGHASDYLPQTYAIWYAYAAGLSEEIRRQLGPIVAHGGRLSRSDNDELYARLVAAPAHDAALDDTRAALLEAFDRMAASIGDASSSSRRLSGDLSEFSRDVITCQTPLDLEQCIAEIADKARRSSEELSQVQERLRESEAEVQRMNQDLRQIREEVYLDILSGLPNRRRFEHGIGEMVDAAARTGDPLALLLIDIDQFKSINDAHGHPFGDRVIHSVAQAIKAALKGGRELPARYGGDEFAVLLPGATARDGVATGEFIRRIVERERIVEEAGGAGISGITLSVGVAQWRRGEGAIQLLRRADGALYRAKRGGRNRVENVD